MTKADPKESKVPDAPSGINPLHFWIIKRYPIYQLFDPSVYRRIGMLNLMRYLIRLGIQFNWGEIKYEIWRIFGARRGTEKRRLLALEHTAAREMHNEPTARIAVVVHVHYPSIWPELKSHLHHIPVPFDLYVSLTCTLGFSAEEQIRQEFPGATIQVIPNRGRDILGFQMFSGKVLDPSRYDLVCKVHSKTSPHIANGDEWRRDLLDGVLGSRERILDIISHFDSDPKAGMVAGSSCLASYFAHTLDADLKTKMKPLAERLKIDPIPNDFVFVAGTMFWARVTALADLKHLDLHDEDFEAEDGRADGLLAHAYERLFGLQVFSGGFNYAATPTYRVRPFWLARSYRYLQGFH